METQTVNVFRENTAEEVKKKMTAGEKTVTAECTVLTVQGKGMPQEQPADGIKSFTEFVGEMDDYDRPVALPHMEKNPVLDKEVRVIMDDCGHQLYAWMDKDADGRMSLYRLWFKLLTNALQQAVFPVPDRPVNKPMPFTFFRYSRRFVISLKS